MMHSLYFTVVVNFFLGGVLGAIGGLFGIGGGLIAIPVLGFLYGMDQQLAQGTALVMIVPNVVIGFWRYKQRNKIELSAALQMAVPAVFTTYFAARFATSIEARSLHLAFALFMVVLALYYLWTLLRRKKEMIPRARLPQKYIFLMGLAAGASAGFFSVGGAIVAVPGLVGLFGMTQTAAQGLGLAMVTPGTLVALWTYASAGHVDWSIGIPLALGGVLSISWGVALAHHLPERRLRMLFCGALIAIAAWMMTHG
ncbi:sulfite exporter TauE/SafE family protein [Herbaspirillum lusitanum]|uniref:sulfite exporter TauE/SafE family protein n=1 Tax=Herbaspirillum lusitanum TaxID=213312 RepID=UPI002237912D|nr:sulfite exporter TauE/SafE family protein [Herbaspirillum lusitanum]MCW5299168.1 sulfite exporter TauE/SafE family protein [Herbaspirillum lusitanum]